MHSRELNILNLFEVFCIAFISCYLQAILKSNKKKTEVSNNKIEFINQCHKKVIQKSAIYGLNVDINRNQLQAIEYIANGI